MCVTNLETQSTLQQSLFYLLIAWAFFYDPLTFRTLLLTWLSVIHAVTRHENIVNWRAVS